MIEKLDLSGVHYEIDERLKKYVNKKIGKLDMYLPRHARRSVHAEVWLKEAKKGPAKYACEVLMHLPGENFRVQESAINMYAAVDIIDTKVKNLLKKYKDKHTSPRTYRKVLRRLRRGSA